MSPSLLAIVKSAEEWTVDGTFDITKWTLFSQATFSFIFSFNFQLYIFSLFLQLALFCFWI